MDDATLLAALHDSRTVDPAALSAFVRGAAPRLDTRIKAAVRGSVEIIRDRAGIPHVFAGDTADLFFGLGVAMAQDRLWQMDRLRRRALGRQAEVLGAAYLPQDIAHRTVGIPAIAAREADAMDGATRSIVEALVAGINRQIEAFGTTLPIEFRVLDDVPEPFTVRDVVAIGRGIWWSLNGRIDRIVAAEAATLIADPALRALFLTPEASDNLVLPAGTMLYDPAAARTAAGTDDATGSNNWALSGARTASGRPIVAGDPHQPFWLPSTWYEYGLHGPEDDVAGAGHPGFPGLWWGSTGRTAWSITNNAASTRDLYAETLDAQGRYRDGADWRAFALREESIAVRDAPPHRLTVRETVRGPIVNALVPSIAEAGDPPLSLRWVGMEHIDDVRAGIALSRAADFAAFRDALRDWSVAVFNFIYADAAGTIGYQMAGRIPVRGRVTYGLRDPADPADAWQGHIPFHALPHVENPGTGVVASANQRIVPGDFPHPIYGAYSQGHRGVRLAEVLAAPGQGDAGSSIRLQNDVLNTRAVRTVPHILALLADEPGTAYLLRDALAGWDGAYTLDSAGPTAFETFMAQWQRAVLGAVLPARLVEPCMQQTGLAVALLEDPGRAFFLDGTRAKAIEVAEASVAALRARLGEDWRWRHVHVAHWAHPLAALLGTEAEVGPAPVDGGSHTIRNTGGELPPHAASSGAEYRMVVDFATPDRFLAVQNAGNSGVPGSPHFRDQFVPWIEGGYHTVALTRAGVEADRAATTVIDPI